MSLRCFFIVQGEGRGHLTQAMALRRLLRKAGHRVEGVVVGQSRCRMVPSFFEDTFEAPVTFVDSPSFVPDRDDRSVRPWFTLVHELRRMPSFLQSLATVHEAVEAADPDVIVNFFEPLSGFYAQRYGPSAPIVAVAHQYMFHHPTYEFPQGWRVQRWGARVFASVTAWGASRRLALSLYSAPDRPERELVVLPPLLRKELFRQPTGASGDFFLVYILNSGYAEEVIRWHRRNPEVQLHCFWDRPDAAPVEQYDDTLTFHQLDDDKFVSLMAQCRGFVSTAGFESIAEAMYLGKPVQVVPVDGHFEQLCNAVDTVRAEAGIRSRGFDIDQLRSFLSDYAANPAAFRRWVRRSRARFVREIEAVAARTDVKARSTTPESELPVVETLR